MKYFAYGSNMSLLRLWQRVPSAVRIGVFTLQGHQLRFHKLGKDGSGKCDAYQTNNTLDLGRVDLSRVIFERHGSNV